jgi:hypothetical protein
MAGLHFEPRDPIAFLIGNILKRGTAIYFLSCTSWEWIALITANIYSHSDRARKHYCSFQSTMAGLHFEPHGPIAFLLSTF